MNYKKYVNGEIIDMTSEEVIEIEAMAKLGDPTEELSNTERLDALEQALIYLMEEKQNV